MAGDNTKAPFPDMSSTAGEAIELEASHIMSASQIQDLINRSVQAALASAAHPSTSGEKPKKGKALSKRKHIAGHSDSPAGEENNMPQTGPTPACHTPHVKEYDRPLGLKENNHKRHKSTNRAKPNSFDTSNDESSEASEVAETTDSESDTEEAGFMAENSDATPDIPSETLLDSLGQPFFSPEAITHPRSGDWAPLPQVADYIEFWTRRSLDRANRNKLRAECPRPYVARKVASTPEIDPVLVKYLTRSGKYAKKGIERSFKVIQDRILDLLGPLTKILNLSEQAASTAQPVDLIQLRGWAQRAICMLGSANTTCSIERRRSILMKLEPQLSHLAETEPGPSAEGLLFGEDLIKNINKFVSLFTSLDKAQSSLKKAGPNTKVFGKAGRGRGRPVGRSAQYRPYTRPATQPYAPTQQPYALPVAQPAPFFPPRGRPWRGRGGRGFPRSRPTTGY
ncbi:uncharacterized protein LOC130295417 isoform X2 [Hyla sarda]|uniref:uncharacterized protein LOC130295417 isoform X2 n=1 Tax=Hyla sarda TaxID=327740 RepID=UPI0024C2E165|nr:uncharacterized protein LOC130295417 isoform X2 [Hyla sarda]